MKLLGLFLGVAALLVASQPSNAVAQAVNITAFNVLPDTARQVSFPSAATNYYILYRGNSLTNITTPVRVGLGSAATTILEDRTVLLSNSFYRVATVPTNAPLDLDADGVNDVAELAIGSDPLIKPSIVINEIDYDSVSNPDSSEFVEIFNPSSGSVSLTNLLLIFINGSGGLEYYRVPLTGTLAAGQYLVVGSASVIATLPVGTLTITIPDNTIQNGAPDGVMIMNPVNNGVFDAFSYEGASPPGIVMNIPTTFNLVEGIALSAATADSNTVNGSLARLPNGIDTNNGSSDWTFTSTPTPGAPNVP